MKNSLMMHLKDLEKEEQTKITRRWEIIRIRPEVNGIETKNKNKKDQRNKKLFFENINKMDKPLARITKKKKKTQN